MTFEKGKSGNPGGRKKGQVPLSEELRILLNKKASDGKRHKDKLAEELVSLSHHPDPNVRLKAITAIYDRVDGKPKQATELTGADGAGLVFTVRLANDDGDDAELETGDLSAPLALRETA